MSGDFKASQVQTNKIIATGSFAGGSNNQILVYPITVEDVAAQGQGAIDPTQFSTTAIGTDVLLYVSGAIGGRETITASTMVVGGDFHVSGNISVEGTGLGAVAPIHFQQNGPIEFLLFGGPTDFVDGLREVGTNAEVSSVVLSQEIDGTGGTTKVELYKVDTVGTETQITVTDSLTLLNGGGASDKARSVSTSFIGTSYELEPNDRLGVKITGVQTGPAADVTVSVFLAGAELASPPGLPEDNEVTQALLRTVTGTTFENIGAIYLPAGIIQAADSRVFMGVDNLINDAELEIRDAVTSALITTITKTGLPADVQPIGNIGIPSDGWYTLRLRADTALVQATLFGLKFVYTAGQGTRIRQSVDATVTGTTFENVGSVYLPVGTLLSPGRIFAGATTAGPDAATVELRRETGGALIATWTAAGTLQEMTQGGAIGIPASDWYNIRLKGSGAAVVALLKGIDWTVLT